MCDCVIGVGLEGLDGGLDWAVRVDCEVEVVVGLVHRLDVLD